MAGKNNALVLNEKDSVCVVLEELNSGDDISYSLDGKEFLVKAFEHIPIYHKAAVSPVKAGEPVYKYGQVIGRATCDITAGQHVHTHNLVSIRESVGA